MLTFMHVLNNKHLKTEIELFHGNVVYTFFFLLFKKIGLKMIRPMMSSSR